MKMFARTSTRTLSARFLLGVLALLASAAFAQDPAQSPAQDAEALRVQALAEEAYLYGMPMVMSYALMYAWAINPESPQYRAPFNQMHSGPALATHKETSIPFYNNDTLYSTVWLDLRAEPVVISLPAIAAPRYYSLLLIDGAAMNVALVSSRSSPRKAGHYLVAGPDWQGKAPAGITEVFRAPTQFSLAAIRIQTSGASDIAQANVLQQQLRATPLSGYVKTAVPPAPTFLDFPKIDRELVKTNFFAYLDFVLQFEPAQPEDREIRAKLASLGIGNGQFDEFKALAAKYRREIGQGVVAGEQRLAKMVADTGPVIDGWNWTGTTLDIDRASYQGNYVKRAALMKIAPYGLNASEAVYPMARTSVDGAPLDGSKHSYTLTFPAGQLPPADTFWSLTAYHATTGAFVDNPINRYLLNSSMLSGMKKNADGSLTFYLQKDSPGADKYANWLPVADGGFSLILRLYGPQAIVRQGGWKVPPVVSVALTLQQ